MLILRIRQAETAMDDGRLDEAFELARREDVRSHRRGQGLIGRLVRSFVERGRRHLDGGQFQQAAADCEKAERLGGNLAEVAALRADIGQAISSRQRSERRRGDLIAAAKEHVENGRLSIGQDLLGDMSRDSGRAGKMRQEIGARREAAEAAIKRARSAMDRGDWAAAVDALSEARQAHATNESLAELTAWLTSSVNQQIRSALVQGRLDLAELLLARLLPVAGQAIQTLELDRIVVQCRQAGECLSRGRPEQACEVLRRLVSILPECEWMRDALAAAERAGEGLNHLRGGPLGLVAAAQSSVGRPAQSEHQPLDPTRGRASVQGDCAAVRLPTRFVIRVDGVGSYLVLRGRTVTIGPASSSRTPVLALMIDAGMPQTTVERVEDDYFLSSGSPVSVNGRPTTKVLLSDGDKIALSPRVRLRFGLPHAASTSAVLDLAGTRLPTGDVRRVILLDKSLVIGPGPSAHIPADQLTEPVVLSVRDGRLCCGGRRPVTVGDRPMERQAGFPTDRQVRVGEVSFVITAA